MSASIDVQFPFATKFNRPTAPNGLSRSSKSTNGKQHAGKEFVIFHRINHVLLPFDRALTIAKVAALAIRLDYYGSMLEPWFFDRSTSR